MSFSLRIDRIDELENGKKLIIDYKMGNNQTINDWFGERPLNPQLPLYTAIDPTHTIGIAFAQIHAGLPSFKGISQYSLDIKGIKLIDDWQKQIADWKNITHQLSHDFYHGQSAVDPKEPSVCHWCALKTFCRIEEIT
jgi:ATP-dependent helicase/nuclease subunit B